MNRWYGHGVLALILVMLLVTVFKPWRVTKTEQRDNNVPRQTYVHTNNHDNGCQPSKTPYSYSQAYEDYSLFVHYFAKPIVCNGTFVELGASDGIAHSNSKFFEEHLGWNGVLIEANPDNAKMVMQNRPHTKNFALAVCPEGQTSVTFRGKKGIGGIESFLSQKHVKRWLSPADKAFDVPCKPISSILKEAKVEKIDFFSLDVEGAELMVLQTMDWTIPVRIFMIEMGHGIDSEVINFLRERGFKKADWDFRKHCSFAYNTVFENTNW